MVAQAAYPVRHYWLGVCVCFCLGNQYFDGCTGSVASRDLRFGNRYWSLGDQARPHDEIQKQAGLRVRSDSIAFGCRCRSRQRQLPCKAGMVGLPKCCPFRRWNPVEKGAFDKMVAGLGNCHGECGGGHGSGHLEDLASPRSVAMAVIRHDLPKCIGWGECNESQRPSGHHVGVRFAHPNLRLPALEVRQQSLSRNVPSA